MKKYISLFTLFTVVIPVTFNYLRFIFVDSLQIFKAMNLSQHFPYFSTIVLLLLSFVVIYVKVQYDEFRTKLKSDLEKLSLVNRYLQHRITYKDVVVNNESLEKTFLTKYFTNTEIETLVKEGYIKTNIV